MKQLKKLLLIHWHYFSFELVDFGRINFLTGKNASGKSTIIDAMQLLLLGDANGRHFFNKAANEKSARSLKGYLRGELGDDGGSGFKYLRPGRFTSYIACEFYDDVKKTSFTLGVVFDCYEDGQEDHRFFVLDSKLPESNFLTDNIPWTYKELRTYVNKNYKRGRYEFPVSGRGFQEIIKGKLGGLKNKYFSLFKKAVSFTPITDIETFITEYVCDIKAPVDISLMQDNIRYYKRLEYDADLMEARMLALQDIFDRYNTYMDEKRRLEIQSYIIDRARLQVASDEIAALEGEKDRLEKEIGLFSRKATEASADLVEARAEGDRLKADRQNSDIYQKQSQLKLQEKGLEEKIGTLNINIEKTIQKLRKYAYEWRGITRNWSDLTDLPEREMKEAYGEEYGRINQLRALTANHADLMLAADKGNIADFSKGKFQEICGDSDQFKQAATGLKYSIDKRISGCQGEIRSLKKRLAEIDRGIKAYDPKLLALREEIKRELAKKHGRDVPVFILADLLEIRDMRWQKAIEAYLHTQKFYILVEPQYFLDALRVYDGLKFKMGFYDWGLVDTGKLERLNPKPAEGSLAEEIITAYPYARMFIDFVMGRLIKCGKIEDLRNHDRAITESCMLYQGFVARQLNPERWKYPFIGRRALEAQREATTQAIEKATYEVVLWGKAAAIIKNAADMSIMNLNEAEQHLLTIEEGALLPDLQVQLGEVRDELGRLDMTWLIRLEGMIKECEAEILRLEKREKDYLIKGAEAGNQRKTIVEEKLPDYVNQEKEAKAVIGLRYSLEWIEEKGEVRFIKELKSRESAREVVNNFSSQLERTKNQTNLKKDDLETARSEYNREYKMSHDIKQGDNAAYDKELNELKDIKLPQYKGQIQDAKDKAFQQFGDDFLAKLKSNMDTVRSQIDELNSALKESSWGNERYRFTSYPKPEYKGYYDMITDPMLLDGYNIASQLFREKYRDAIDELFRQITDVEGEVNADVRAELEKNIKRFTDYRTYLGFDLVVTDEENTSQRLSRTMRKKSGGETQTPFYISVLASFAQLYRIQDPAYSRTRLIIFDEAFSKMDSERIQESIILLRRFGFQCILSAPPDKIADIAPLVDKNLCVIREKTNSIIRAFDSQKLMEGDLDEL